MDYRDRVELTQRGRRSRLRCTLSGQPRRRGVRAATRTFVIDASGPGGFLARQLAIPSGLERTETRSALVFSHFAGVRSDARRRAGSAGRSVSRRLGGRASRDRRRLDVLAFGSTTGSRAPGFVLTPRGVASLKVAGDRRTRASSGTTLLERYPTIGRVFADATPLDADRVSCRASSIASRARPESAGRCCRTRTRSSTRCSRPGSRGVCARSSGWRSRSSRSVAARSRA